MLNEISDLALAIHLILKGSAHKFIRFENKIFLDGPLIGGNLVCYYLMDDCQDKLVLKTYLTLVAGDHLVVAVQKQYGRSAEETEFQQAELVRAQPPQAQEYMLELPDYFTEDDHQSFPVFDSYGRVRIFLSLFVC